MFCWNKPGNIFSGNRDLAVLTNPTELAYRKGNLRKHYPLQWEGKTYPDLEAAYLKNKADHPDGMQFMIALMVEKFQQHPEIADAIRESGGVKFLEQCSHRTGARTRSYQMWEGEGTWSCFILCLVRAYGQYESKLKGVHV